MRSRGMVSWMRWIGDLGWWLFVVATVLQIGALPGDGMPRRYADYVETDLGWTAYTPVHSIGSGFTQWNIVATAAVVGLVVAACAAVAESVLPPRGLWSAAAPAATAVGAGVLLVGASWADPARGSVVVTPWLVLLVHISAVVIREVGVRWTRSRVDEVSRRGADEAPAPH